MARADPFGGIFSVDGKPSEAAHFCSTTRSGIFTLSAIVDMRWHPVSGRYPNLVEIEMGSSRPRAVR